MHRKRVSPGLIGGRSDCSERYTKQDGAGGGGAVPTAGAPRGLLGHLYLWALLSKPQEDIQGAGSHIR